jgi:hypothetical protein
MAFFRKKNKARVKNENDNQDFVTANPEEFYSSPPDEMQIEEEAVKPEDIPTMPTEEEIVPKEVPILLSALADLEHILKINSFIEVRIYLPKISDINIFKEKLEKINKLLNNPEFQRTFLERKNEAWAK